MKRKFVKSFLKVLLCMSLALSFVLVTAEPVSVYASDSTVGSSVFDAMKTTKDDGTFKDVSDKLSPKMYSLFNLIQKLGLVALAIAILVAVIGLGVMKDSNAVKENKQWLTKAVLAVIGAGSVLSILSTIAKIVI